MSGGQLTVKFNQKTIVLYEGEKVVFQGKNINLEKYLVFRYSMSNFTKKETLRLAKAEMLKVPMGTKYGDRYDPLSPKAREYGIPASKGEMCMDGKGTKYVKQEFTFRMQTTGDRAKDIELAEDYWMKEKGYTNREKFREEVTKGFTWHHMDDLDENLHFTFQLIKSEPHLLPHIGAIGIYNALLNSIDLTKYKK